MTNQIVTLNVTQTVAPQPSQLQRKGALVSQGATTLAPGTTSLLTQASDLTTLLRGALALTSLVWSANVVTATTAAPHGLTVSDTLPMTIAGASPTGYNGTFTCTITGASTFTYPLLSNPGLETVPGSYTPEDVAELSAMVTTFFAQGSQLAVWVLELGAGNAADGVTALSTWINANPGIYYAYTVPRYWAGEATYLAFLAGFVSLKSKTYFFTTMTSANYTSFTALMKCVVGLVEAPGIPSTEFSLAAAFWAWLHYAPSSTNKVTPFAFTYLYGVTAYPTTGGNSVLLAALKAAGVNVVGTGAEGGISNTILFWGTTMDGRDASYWYNVDWAQINADQDLSAAVINGSNLPANPLYYNQDGVSRLQGTLAATFTRGISYGVVQGTLVMTELTAAQFQDSLDAGDFAGKAVINAVPFLSYAAQNPGDYRTGKYAGLYASFVPSRGFTNIVLNLNVTDFVAQ